MIRLVLIHISIATAAVKTIQHTVRLCSLALEKKNRIAAAMVPSRYICALCKKETLCMFKKVVPVSPASRVAIARMVMVDVVVSRYFLSAGPAEARPCMPIAIMTEPPKAGRVSQANGAIVRKEWQKARTKPARENSIIANLLPAISIEMPNSSGAMRT